MNWDAIRKEFEESDITMKDLAEKNDIKPTTLRSRKNREKWKKQNGAENVATQKVVETIQESSELTEKQKLFCLYFSQFNNATKAYQKVYECEYSTAKTNTDIREEIKRIKKARTDDWLVDDHDIVNEWMKQAFTDITDYVEFKKFFVDYLRDEEGMPKLDEFGEMMPYYRNELHFKSSNEVDGTVIQEVKQGKDGVSVKLYDKQRVLIELNKLIGGENVMRLQKMQVELDMAKAQLYRVKAENGDFDDKILEDDGFMSAIKGMVTNKEVWPDEE